MAEPRAKLSRRGLRWALEAIVIGHLTVARVAEAPAVSWNTANDAVLAAGKRVLIDDVHRFDGCRSSGSMNTSGVTPDMATDTSR
jgi:hypothetical protein